MFFCMAKTRSGAEMLAQAVKNRRAQLGLAQGDLGAHGGPSVVVVGQIERGVAKPQPLTLGRLDAALQWPPGTASGIFHGELEGPPFPTGVGRLPSTEATLVFRNARPTVRPTGDDDDLRYQRPANIPDLKWAEIRDRARAFIEFELDQAAKER